MDPIDLDGDFKDLKNLIWLQCRWCSGNCVSTNFNLENLVVLDLTLRTVSDGWGLESNQGLPLLLFQSNSLFCYVHIFFWKLTFYFLAFTDVK